jgi:hypothetical protein
MATCQVWEYYASGNNRNQVAKLPGKAPQNITISSTHAETAALDNATIGTRLLTDTDCWFKLYKSGAASPLGDVCTTANGIKLVAASGPEYFDIPLAAGISLSIITA